MEDARYCLYIDESGIPELTTKGKHCLFTGVIFDETKEQFFNFLLENLKEKYNLSLSCHLHAVDIFERSGSTSFLGLTTRRRVSDLRGNFQKQVWDIIKQYNIPHRTVVVPKDFARKILTLNKRADAGMSWVRDPSIYAHVDNQLPMDVGINALYKWALSKIPKNVKLKVIIEARSSDLFTIRNFVNIQQQNAYKTRTMIAFSEQMKKRVVSISFANKNVMSSGLELADLICYTCNVYFVQYKKKEKLVPDDLKKAISFKAIHKTLNENHVVELSQRLVSQLTPGISPRLRRISDHYKKQIHTP